MAAAVLVSQQVARMTSCSPTSRRHRRCGQNADSENFRPHLFAKDPVKSTFDDGQTLLLEGISTGWHGGDRVLRRNIRPFSHCPFPGISAHNTHRQNNRSSPSRLVRGWQHAPCERIRRGTGLEGSQKSPGQSRFSGSSSVVQTPRASRPTSCSGLSMTAATRSPGHPPSLAPDTSSHIMTLALSPAATMESCPPAHSTPPAPRGTSRARTPRLSRCIGRSSAAVCRSRWTSCTGHPRCGGSAAAHGLVRDDLVRPGQAAPAHGPVPRRPARGPARRPAPLPQPGPAPPAVAGTAHPRRPHRAHRRRLPPARSRTRAAA